MAKILLINPPQIKDGKYIDGYQGVRPKLPPLGLAYIGGLLEKKGHQVKIICGMAEEVTATSIAKISKSFDLIGITSITFNYILSLSVTKEVKRLNPNIPVVLGGPHVNAIPEDVLSENCVDIVVFGEGEYTMLEIADSLPLDNKKLLPIKGIAYKINGQAHINPERELINDLDSLPFPARHLLPMKNYASSGVRGTVHPTYSIMSSRGCPSKCSFCISEKRRILRVHSAEYVVAEIKELISKYNARGISFWDDGFTFKKKRVFEICERIQKENIKIIWDCESKVDTVNSEMLNAMKKAGCVSISYGIESGSKRILNQIGKKITHEKIIRGVKLAKQSGLEVRGYFMFGFPGETEKEMKETILLSKKLPLDFATYSLLIPLPGTEDYQNCKKSGHFNDYYWKNQVLSEISFPLKPLVYVPENISEDRLLELHREANREFYLRPKIFVKRFFSVKDLHGIKELIKGFKTVVSN